MKRDHLVRLLFADFGATMLTGCRATELVKTPAPSAASTVTEDLS